VKNGAPKVRPRGRVARIEANIRKQMLTRSSAAATAAACRRGRRRGVRYGRGGARIAGQEARGAAHTSEDNGVLVRSHATSSCTRPPSARFCVRTPPLPRARHATSLQTLLSALGSAAAGLIPVPPPLGWGGDQTCRLVMRPFGGVDRDDIAVRGQQPTWHAGWASSCSCSSSGGGARRLHLPSRRSGLSHTPPIVCATGRSTTNTPHRTFECIKESLPQPIRETRRSPSGANYPAANPLGQRAARRRPHSSHPPIPSVLLRSLCTLPPPFLNIRLKSPIRGRPPITPLD